MRNAEIARKTNETDIALKLGLDGAGRYEVSTGCGFLDHMLELFARHARFDLNVSCKGDTRVDYHHSVEDVGIALGLALNDALGDRRGICRYGQWLLPMDEALALVAVDISGRGLLVCDAALPAQRVGDFDAELVKEFLIALSREARLTLHVRLICGENTHHCIEAIFKGLGRALRQATAIDPEYADEIPSTKGTLGGSKP